MSIVLNEEQEKELLAKKVEAFRTGLKKLEDETGMTIVPVLDFSPQAITAKAMVVKKDASKG